MTKPRDPPADERPLAPLRASALFGVLDEQALAALARETRLLRLARGQVFQQRGAQVAAVVVVAQGILRVSLSNPLGKRHVLSHLEPGQIFNLLPVVDGGPAIHDGDAATDCVLLLVPAQAFLRCQQQHAELAAAAQQLLNARARAVYDGLADAMLLTLRQRCARALLRLADTLGEAEGHSGAIGIRLAQSEIADMLGNARPVVNRALRELERGGIIELGYQRIVVLRPDALRAAAAT